MNTFTFFSKGRKPFAFILLLGLSFLFTSFLDSNNAIPVASFSATVLSGTAPLSIDFDATNSYDADEDNLIYSWDFGDDSLSVGSNPSHIYMTPGIYLATLTVNDGENISQDTQTIIVHETPNNTAIMSFSDETSLLSGTNYSGVTMSVVDMNGDGKDDIVRYDDASFLNVAYQQGPNQAFTRVDFGDVSNVKQWSNAIADVNKDGFNDILSAGFYDGIKIIYNNNGQTYNSTTIPNSEIFLQGSSFADIDNDGWVDAFACHDDADSREFRNNGDGSFTFAPNMINTTTTPTSDNSGNYGNVWTDYDNDGDIDLYISKCRIGVTSDTDPRRINMLFQNDGNNNYTEVAAAANLKIGAQTWLTDFGDIDNDGDMDCILINHLSNANLMRNNGDGTFTDITSSSGLLPTLNGNEIGIQGFFRDFNNDGFVDLLVSGASHYLFYNDGDGTFTQSANPFNINQIESIAIGDLNHDGFLDVYAGYANIYNSPTDKQDRLFMNDGNANNFMAIQLEGVESNINGIGARVELHGTWGQQIREVRSGEGYGITNSFTQHFGIGTATQISKVVVNWPSGIVDEILNPAPNQFLQIIEGSSNNSGSEPTVSCGGNTTISYGEGTITMSGETGQEYFYQIFDIGWNEFFNCGYQCGNTQTVTGLTAGDYRIFIKNSSYQIICEQIITLSTGANDPDNDGDGVPASQDCNDSDANLTVVGAICDDGNTETSNDVVQANCTCAGTSTTGEGTTISCDGNTTISYGEGAITMSGQVGEEYFFQVFDIAWNEVFNCGYQCGNTQTVTGLTAGDYRIFIKNNVYQVICETIITLSAGGNDPDNDGDGDGVPASQDCNDSDANLTVVGAICDDGNTETNNDVVQANCTCAGTSTTGEGTTISCDGNTTISYGEGTITMSGQVGEEYFFQVFDIAWNEVFNCGYQCGNTQTVTGLTAGDYRIHIKNNVYQVICEQIITLSAGGNDPDNDGDGVSASQDCDDSDANLTIVGASCDDGDIATNNDIVQADCTCAGTIPGQGGATVSCGEITIFYGEGMVDMVGLVGKNYFFRINDLNNGWAQVFDCSWNCGHQQTAIDLPNSRYLITISNDDWSEHCAVEIEMTNSSFTQGASNRTAPQLNFEAFNAQRAVDLQWLTNSGYKVKHFEIERSKDGKNFEALHTMINKEWTEQLSYHQTTDLIPTKGINYYRIKEVYLDNHFTYTETKQVNFQIDTDKLSIYPNPADNLLNLGLKPIMGKKAAINIINAFGQVVQSNDIGLVKQENIAIVLSNSIINGFYHVWIEVEGQQPIIKKLMVKRLY